MQCLKCGGENSADAKFCHRCGNIVSDTPPAAPSPNQAAVQSTPVKVGNRKMVVGAVIAAVLLGMGIVGVYLADSLHRNSLSTAQSEPSLFQSLKCWVGPQEKVFRATVKAGEATFIFPVGKKDKWEWNVGGCCGTQNRGCCGTADVSWEVRVGDPLGGEGVIIGYFHQLLGAPQQSGDFKALIADGSLRAHRVTWIPLPNKRGYGQAGADLGGTSMQLTCGNVIVRFSGKENIQNVFSSRPEKVRFLVIQPGSDIVRQDVSVTYEN